MGAIHLICYWAVKADEGRALLDVRHQSSVQGNGKFPVIRLEFPVLQKNFPDSLLREFAKKSLRHSGFLASGLSP
jgi:hypothetical protein